MAIYWRMIHGTNGPQYKLSSQFSLLSLPKKTTVRHDGGEQSPLQALQETLYGTSDGRDCPFIDKVHQSDEILILRDEYSG